MNETAPLARAARRLATVVAAGAAMIAVTGAGTPKELTGRAIMDEVSRRHEKPIELSIETMILIDGKEIESRRQSRRMHRKMKDGTFRYLLAYDAPAGIAGTAALTWQVKNAQDDQWLFLPALGRLKRIVGGARRKNFMGTDFAFEDLTIEDEDEYAYQREDDTVIDGLPHFVVRAKPTSPQLRDTTGYDSRRIYIRKDNFFITRIEYFEIESKDHVKTLQILDSKPFGPETWRATHYVMTSLADHHATEVKVEKISFDPADVPDRVFEHRYLTSKAHIR